MSASWESESEEPRIGASHAQRSAEWASVDNDADDWNQKGGCVPPESEVKICFGRQKDAYSRRQFL